MPERVLEKDNFKICLLILGLCSLLYFFLPLSHFLYSYTLQSLFGDNPYIRDSFFPFLSLLVFFSLKPTWSWNFSNITFFLLSTPLPVFISYLFGKSTQWPGDHSLTLGAWYWYVICIPIGEELLFRGWTFEIFQRRFPGKEIFLTSLLFSFWHLQNLSYNPVPLVLFQVVYTFFTGVWLAEIRVRCRNLIPSCLAHSLINLAATIP